MRKSKRLKENIGIHGAGMDKFDLMRTLGLMGPALHKGGPVELDEVIKVAKAINDALADPDDDNIVAYSRGAAILAQAVRLKMVDELPPVVMLAPAIYRGWTTAPSPKLPFGSYVLIGERDDRVSIKQACRAGVDSGVPVWVVPGLSHTGVLYTHGEITRDAYKIDAARYLSDRSTPDWGTSPRATREELQRQVEMAPKFSFNKRESRSSILRDLIRETVLLMEMRNAPGGPVPADSKYFARPTGDGFVLYYDVGPNGGPQAIPGTIGFNYSGDYIKGAQPISGPDYRLTPDEKAKAEELVKLGLYSKSERTTDYPEISFQYRQNRSMTPESMWGDASDVPKTYYSYGPAKQGFDFLLVDTENKLVSLDSSWKGNQPRRPGGKPGTANQDKTYVMPSGDVEFTTNTLSLQKLFKHIMSADHRVTADYKIISPDDKFSGKTIGQVSGEKRATDVALGGTPGRLIVYHGTSTKRWPEIEKKGLVPGKFEVAYSDQIPGYSVKNLYFTMDPHTAENYATRAAVWDKGAALILKVEIPDITRIVPDEDSMGWFELKREYNLKRTEGEDKFGGGWDSEKSRWITVVKPREGQFIGKQQHVKTMFSLLRQANQSKAYGKQENEEPDAGPEWVKDEEYYALLKDVEQGMVGFLTSSLRDETFAYRGWIPPKFIKKWKEYPRVAYPKSVDKGFGGKGDEYQTTRQDVLKRVKRFDKNESLVRSLVRSILTEALAPNFASSVTHSAGWISPGGEYFYDPNRRDHGEWAAFQAEKDPKLMEALLEELKKQTGPIPPPPPRTPEEQAVYDKKSPTLQKMLDWQRQGGRSLKGKSIPPYKNMEELYYSDIQSEVRFSAQRALLMNGWGKVSNAYGLELWVPSRVVIETWMNLGMEAGSDPEMYHTIYGNKKTFAEGDWNQIERFMRSLS